MTGVQTCALPILIADLFPWFDVTAFNFGVAVILAWWFIGVTVIKLAIGLPTILLLPRITHFFPFVSILYLLRSSSIPFGVAEIKHGKPIARRPTLIR